MWRKNLIIYRPKKLWRGGEVEDLVSTKQGFMKTFGKGSKKKPKSVQSFTKLVSNRGHWHRLLSCFPHFAHIVFCSFGCCRSHQWVVGNPPSPHPCESFLSVRLSWICRRKLPPVKPVHGGLNPFTVSTSFT